MKCVICEKEFSSVREDARYCGANCRSRAYRQRLQQAAKAGGAQNSAAPANVDIQPDHKRSVRLAAAASAGLSPRPRVALEDQILSQAPASAYFYQLLLGLDHARNPVMAPDNRASWSIYPFAAPEDVRLEEAKSYRIIWLDRQGHELQPSAPGPTPILHFFLGSPDAQPSTEGRQIRQAAENAASLRQLIEQGQQSEQLLRKKLKRIRKRQELLSTQNKQLKRELRREKKRRQAQQGHAEKRTLLGFEVEQLVKVAALVGATGYVANAERAAPIREFLSSILERIGAGLKQGNTLEEILEPVRRVSRNLALMLLEFLEAIKNAKPAATVGTEAPQAEPGPVPAPESPAQHAAPLEVLPKHNDTTPRPKKGLQPTMELGQSAPLLALLCEISPPQVPTSLAQVLIQSSPMMRLDNSRQIPGYSLFWDAFQATTALTKLGEKLEQVASLPADEAHNVTNLALLFVDESMKLQALLRQNLVEIEESRMLTQSSLDDIRWSSYELKQTLLRLRPGPDDSLAQVLHDALLSIRKILRDGDAKAIEQMGAKREIPLEALPSNPSEAQRAARQAVLDALAPMKWELQLEAAAAKP